MAKTHSIPITPEPMPCGNDRDGNNVSEVAECPHVLEIERGHRVYHEGHDGYPTHNRIADDNLPDYLRRS